MSCHVLYITTHNLQLTTHGATRHAVVPLAGESDSSLFLFYATRSVVDQCSNAHRTTYQRVDNALAHHSQQVWLRRAALGYIGIIVDFSHLIRYSFIMAKQLSRLPLGISDFAKLREAGQNYLYVDKTARILDLLNASNYLFLARPRRFGKSLLCSTLKYLYEGRRELFAGLAIDPVWDWTGTNPVVHLSLTETSSATPQTLENSLLKLLQNRASDAGLTLTSIYSPQAMPELLRHLEATTGRKVVVIIDEYEKPVHDHITDPEMARKMRDVLSQFYGSLKGCDAHLEKLFITGIGRMVKTSIFSELNQMKDVTLHPSTSEICGYTEQELHRDFAPFIVCLAEQNNMTKEQAGTTLKDRYNGYWWGKGEKVYNPWAILNCLADNEFGSYWWSSGTPGVLVDMADSLQRPDGDLEGIQADDLSLLFDINQPKAEPLLWQSGYLTIKEVSGQLYTLGFPNAEVREAWYSMMLSHFAGPKGPSGSTSAMIMLDSLNRGDRPRFEQALRALFAAIPYNLHQKNEAYYHSIFFAVIKAIGGEILPEPSSSLGRADAVIETDKAIYVIEFKLGRASDALAQIEEKHYYEPFLSDPRPVVLLGAGGFEERKIECIWKDVKKF